MIPIIVGKVKRIIKVVDLNQIFSRKEIKEELGYGDIKWGEQLKQCSCLI